MIDSERTVSIAPLDVFDPSMLRTAQILLWVLGREPMPAFAMAGPAGNEIVDETMSKPLGPKV